MFPTSQRQKSDYSLTSRLLGDPRPDRHDHSDMIRATVRWKIPLQDFRMPHVEHKPMDARVLDCLKALALGYTTSAAIAEALGASRDMTAHYLKRARNCGWVEISSQVNAKSGGRIYQYALTDAGKAELAR